jgi:hypothetical protein
MSDQGTDTSEPTGEPVMGTLELDERDLRAAIVDASWLLRARFGIAAILAFSYGTLAFMSPAAIGQMVQPITFGALVVALLFVMPYFQARKLLAAIAKGGDKRASFRFDDDGVTLRTAGSTTTTTYRSLVEYREGKTAFLIYSSPNVGNVVPKRAFSPEGLARVGALLAANVKPRRARSASKILVAWFVAILMFMVVWQFLSKQRTAPRAPASAETRAPAP